MSNPPIRKIICGRSVNSGPPCHQRVAAACGNKMCHTHCKASASHCNAHNKIAATELHIRPQDVILPMPPLTEEQIRARKERIHAASLSPSLAPPSPLQLDVTPLSHSPQVSTQAETSGDRAEQRAAMMNHTSAGASNASAGPSNHTGPTINPRCTTQMGPVWLVQSRERETALETRSRDAAEQKKRALIVQRQFILEYFDHVCFHLLSHHYPYPRLTLSDRKNQWRSLPFRISLTQTTLHTMQGCISPCLPGCHTAN